MSILALDIGGTKLTAALFEHGQLVRRERRATDREGGRDWMVATIEEIAATWQHESRFAAIGIGFGGPVDWPDQRIACSTHVGGWQDFRLAQHLSERFSCPAVMDNDANVGALGEGVAGAGRDARPLLYMTLSTGIGGGLLLDNNQLYRGADSFALEIGHVTIQPDGPECLCGARGCLERLCSGLWLEQDHGVAPPVLFQDPAFVQNYCRQLAQGIKAALLLLNPAAVVLGGGIAKQGDHLLQPLRAELGRQITAWARCRVDVRQAALGDDSVLWGAWALAQQSFVR